MKSPARCSACSLSALCLPNGLNRAELERLDGLVQQGATLADGQALVRQGADFRALFAVRTGMFKSYKVAADGVERVLNFHLPGELIGLDAIYPGDYQANVAALGTSSVCTLPYGELTALSSEIAGLQHQLLRMLSREISQQQGFMPEASVDQRLAGFLLSLSERLAQRGYSGTRFNLAMPRRDIANYLNMAPETISRAFKKLQDNHIISLDRRDLTVRDPGQLKHLAGCAS